MTPDLRAHLQSTLGDAYHLGRELGGGGMSRVFIAEDAALRRSIVVKLLPPEMAADLSIARFQREIALAAQLQHPHIVSLLSHGESEGLPYYTMPFVDGETLRERLARAGELPVNEGMRLLREIATALAYAHEKGIVHRDIKPENVLLSGGIALVTDFGVAKAILASATSGVGALTSAGVAVGTPAYMSPEQVTADPAVDHRADIYALGMIAYEMFAGQTPFAGRTGQALLAAHVIDTPEPLQKRRPAVPPALAALVMACLEKRPADRPQSAEEIVKALDAMATPTHTTVPTRFRARRLPRATTIGLALVAIVAAGGAWLRFGSHNPASAIAASRLLIAPFENLTGDARFDHIGRIAADRLAMVVAQQGTMEVVPSNMVLISLRDTTGGQADRLKRLSEATHAGMLVSGTVVLRGDSLTLQAQVTDVRTGKAVITLDPANSAASDPIAAVDALADRLLGALGVRQFAILSQDYRPPKFAAYQAFASGFERFAVYGDNAGSRPFFERAIAIDSTYTRAYLLLARQYLNAGEYDRADSQVRRIERLSGLNATERLQLDYYKAELNGDLGGMLRAQQQVVARDSSALALFLVGEEANALLRPRLAVPALEQSQAAFHFMGGHAELDHTDLLTEAFHQAGEDARSLSVLVAKRALFPDAAMLRGDEFPALAALGRNAAALALADTLLHGTNDRPGYLLALLTMGAAEFRAHGDPQTSARLFELGRAWIGSNPARVPSPAREMAEGVLMFGAGMHDSAMARFVRLARDTTRLDAAGYLALTQVARGDRAHAGAVADSLGALHRPWLHGRHTYWRAAIRGALGERDLAVQLLQQSHREGQSMQWWHYEIPLAALQGYPAFETLVRPQR